MKDSPRKEFPVVSCVLSFVKLVNFFLCHDDSAMDFKHLSFRDQFSDTS